MGVGEPTEQLIYFLIISALEGGVGGNTEKSVDNPPEAEYAKRHIKSLEQEPQVQTSPAAEHANLLTPPGRLSRLLQSIQIRTESFRSMKIKGLIVVPTLEQLFLHFPPAALARLAS